MIPYRQFTGAFFSTLFLLTFFPFISKAQRDADLLITSDYDTIYDVKIKSNPFFTNQHQLTTKKGRVYKPKDLILYSDNYKYYYSKTVGDERLLLEVLNIGPNKLLIGRRTDSRWDAYLSHNAKIRALDNNNLYESLTAKLDSSSIFEKTVQTKKVKDPHSAATYLASYNAFLIPDKYVGAKFKTPDILSFSLGARMNYYTSVPENFNLNQQSSFVLMPYFDLTANFGKLSLVLDFAYLQSSIEWENLVIDLNTISSTVYLDLRLWSDSYNSVDLSGGFIYWFDSGSELTNTTITATGDNLIETLELGFNPCPTYGLRYTRKFKKNRYLKMGYHYLTTNIENDLIDPFGFAPRVVNYTSHVLSVAYNLPFF